MFEAKFGDDPLFGFSATSGFDIKSRARPHQIFKLSSNLKHLINEVIHSIKSKGNQTPDSRIHTTFESLAYKTPKRIEINS